MTDSLLGGRLSEVSVRALSAKETENELSALVVLLRDSVDGGASLGFIPPLDVVEARDYWLSIVPEIASGSRLLLVAKAQGRVVGTGQLSFPPWRNGRHRADLQKLFVNSRLRRAGIGKVLMSNLHAAALQRGRTLLVLQTQGDKDVRSFYERLGYMEAGVIPDFTRGAEGRRYDNATYYLHLHKHNATLAAPTS